MKIELLYNKILSYLKKMNWNLLFTVVLSGAIGFFASLIFIIMKIERHFVSQKASLFFNCSERDVWGNFPEWIMLTITAITGIFLIKSFRAQEAINKLSFDQHSITVMPIFTLEHVVDKTSKLERNYQAIRLYQGHAKYVNIDTIDSSTYNHRSYQFLSSGHILPFEFKRTASKTIHAGYVINFLQYWIHTDDPQNLGARKNIGRFRFSDIIGNLYEQILYWENGELLFTYPEKKEYFS